MNPQVKNNTEYKCEFCNKEFIRENSLLNHTCIIKMRWLEKDNRNVVIGFMSYKRFYQLTNTHKKSINYKDFIKSKFYNDFIKFGLWLNDSFIINPQQYIDYVIKNNVKLKDWTKESIYNDYIKELLFKEKPLDAITRSIEWIQKWSSENNIEIKDFFNKLGNNRLVDSIRNGRLSPWIIFISKNSNDLLTNLDQSQYKLLGNLLDKNLWQLKIHKYQKEFEECKEIVRNLEL